MQQTLARHCMQQPALARQKSWTPTHRFDHPKMQGRIFGTRRFAMNGAQPELWFLLVIERLFCS